MELAIVLRGICLPWHLLCTRLVQGSGSTDVQRDLKAIMRTGVAHRRYGMWSAIVRAEGSGHTGVSDAV